MIGSMNSDTLVLERADGWPNRAARFYLLLGAGLLLFGGAGAAWAGEWSNGLRGGVASGLLCVLMGLTLAAWRRGVTLRRDNLSLSRWWGISVPGLPTWILRELDCRSISGYTELAVDPVLAHYKRWKEMYRILLTQSQSLDYVVVDDEFPTPDQAQVLAARVADFLKAQYAESASSR
ncbi:MAG: hypothetical protein HY319_14485 [Armatimonadetes bacterium]|nr:hypothetical protein [Armatimonadota bacterium]